MGEVLWRDWALPAALAVGVVLGLLGWAGAADVLPPPHPNPGEFIRADAPVYPQAPDGWACHYLGSNERLVGQRCLTPDEHVARGAAPVRRSERLGEPVGDVICGRGQFVLIHTARGRGWAAQRDVHATAVRRDGRSRVSGCDTFTWS